jgi:hypothetical protein
VQLQGRLQVNILQNMKRNMKRRMKVKPKGMGATGAAKRMKIKGFKAPKFGGMKGY